MLRDLLRLRGRLSRLVDKDAIVELHDRFGTSMDASDFDGLARVFTSDAVVEGWTEPPLRGKAMIIQRLREINAEHLGSHRMITNHRIELQGDRARSVVHYRSAHLDDPPKVDEPGYIPTHSHEGWYLTEAVRTHDGWRLSRLKHVSLSNAGIRTSEGRATVDEIRRFVP